MKLGGEYRRIWAGNASSNLADGVTFVALPLLATTITHNPAAISALSVAYSLPRILSVLGSGVLIDRFDRRRLLYLANLSQSAIFAALTALVLVDATPIAALYVVYAVMGIVETLSDSAAIAVPPQAVVPEGLERANSQIAGTQIVVDEFLGPPLGGFLFAMAAFAPSVLNVGAFLLAGFAYWRLRNTYVPRRDERAERPAEGIVAEIREGAVWALRHKVVRTLVLIGGLASVGYMIPFSYLVLYAREVLGLSPTGYGLLLSFSAVGGLLGSVVADRLRRKVGYGWSIVAALTVGALSFAAISLLTSALFVAVALAAYIAHSVVWNVLATSIRQKVIPTAMMGRVIAANRLVGLCGLAVGAAGGGVLASNFGYRVPFDVAGGFFAVAALLAFATIGSFRTWELEEKARIAVHTANQAQAKE